MPTPITTLQQALQKDNILTLRPSCKPSQDPNYTTIQAISIRCTVGNTHYVTGNLGKDGNGHEKWINFKGESITINPAYIVLKAEVDLIHSTLDITQHINYGGKNTHKKVINHTIHAVPAGTKVVVANEISSSSDKTGPGIQIKQWVEISE